jgi:hypothetical protein
MGNTLWILKSSVVLVEDIFFFYCENWYSLYRQCYRVGLHQAFIESLLLGNLWRES